MANTKDMTKGSPARLIASFALPLMLGNVFQQMYTMVDTMVVGQGVGVEALASLGAADWLNWMVLSIIMGFTQGFSLLCAQNFGASNLKELRRSTAHSLMLCIGIALLFTVLGQCLIRPVLALLDTPDNVVGGAITYLTIVFAFIPAITAYNFCASILRSLGDGKTPLYAMITASIVNVALDLLFVMVFRWGIAGAAIATGIAQVCSFLFCLRIMRKIPQLYMSREDFRPEAALFRKLLKLASPMAFQNLVISVGGLVVQSVVNGFGFIFMAGYTATNKLYGLLEIAATSFGFSMATYTGQNLGAGRIDRIKKGMNKGLLMAIFTAVLISLIMVFLGRSIVGLFISGTPEEVLQVTHISYTYLLFMAAGLPILYMLYMYRSALQGMGDTVVPMLSGIVELIMRIGIVLTLPAILGEYGIYLAEEAAWVGATVLLGVMYYVRVGRLSQAVGDLPQNPSE